MAAEVQHTLLNLEVTPPPGAWNTIASRLDTEFDANEIKLSGKLTDFEVVPPAAAWQQVEAAMAGNTEAVQSAPAIVIRRPFRRMAVAAAAIVVLALGGWYMMNREASPTNEFTVVPLPATNDIPATAPGNDAAANSVAPDEVVVSRPLPRRQATIVAAAQRVKPAVDSTNNLPELAPELLANLQPAGLQNVQSFSNASPNVEAPPIRDADGNIILDKDLIFASDNNYIVVTGPNGEQTRISSKFLPLISSLNGKSESLDYFQFFLNENNIWKLRFNEWRDKMIKSASFIPTATNLLDIIELKEILSEN